MTNSKKYTASDFERYYNGSMPENEMHALERAALDDPFLADALEGYAFTQTPVKDIADLRSRIHEKKENKKVIPLFSKTGWWRVAAILAVGIGSVYLFLMVNHTRQANPVAVATKNKITHNTQPSIATSDTIQGNSIATVNEPLPGKPEAKNGIAAEGMASQRSVSEKKNRPGLVQNLKQNVLADTLRFTVASNDKIESSAADKALSKKYFLKGRVVDAKGAPVINATVRNEDTRVATITDESGNFMLPSEDSAAMAVVSAVGYDSKKIQLQRNTRQKVSLQSSNAELDEVVVTGYASSNKSAAPTLSKMLKEKSAGVEITDSLDDYQQFNSYLRIHKQDLYDSNNVQLTGEVTLSFDVDEDGFPEDIHVLKSTCKGCEDNAIGLLKKGPAWSRKKKKHTVSIKY